MLSVRMRLILLVVFLYLDQGNAASIKKSVEKSSSQNKIITKKEKLEPKKSGSPVIIAFEIVDEPEKNTTGKSNSKRTIESSLGYGYHGPSNSYAAQNPQHGKKFVIYKYSQNDIPPVQTYLPPPKNHYSSGSDIQKSIGYSLGTITSQANGASSSGDTTSNSAYIPQQQATQYYNPGTTLYTTYDQHGLGGISSQVPYQNHGHSGMVPVIILRVYSNQLASPQTALHTNLPESHPHADLNNVNLQSYLQNYVQQYLQNQQQAYQPSYQQQYEPQYQSQYQSQYQPQYQQTYTQNYQTADYYPNLQTYENFPSKQHTRVVYHSDNNGHIPVTSQMYKTPGLSSYKSVSYPMYVPPQEGYSNAEEPTADEQYAYTTDDKTSDQQYMYVYPNDIPQQEYYQDNGQQYDPNVIYEDNANAVQDSATQEAPVEPYNYHAHPPKQSSKEKRSKPNKVSISSTSSPKRRE